MPVRGPAGRSADRLRHRRCVFDAWRAARPRSARPACRVDSFSSRTTRSSTVRLSSCCEMARCRSSASSELHAAQQIRRQRRRRRCRSRAFGGVLARQQHREQPRRRRSTAASGTMNHHLRRLRPTRNRAGESDVLPLLNPHGLRDDELHADPVAVDFAAGDDRVLTGEGVEPFDPQPPRRGVAERRSAARSCRAASASATNGVDAAPGRRTLRVEPAPVERHPDVAAQLLAAGSRRRSRTTARTCRSNDGADGRARRASCVEAEPRRTGRCA